MYKEYKMENKKTIPELVILPSQIKGKDSFSINTNNNMISCNDCNSSLFYIKINWGVVAEEYDYGILGNKDNRVYVLREIGFSIYCAKCGEFNENYYKYFYPEDKLVMSDFDLDEIDEDERAEIEVCLNQFNQKKDFTARYKIPIFTELKKKLKEYEDKHKIKEKKENGKY